MLKHREEQFDPQLYKECYFKLQNMMGTCRFLLNDHFASLAIFQKMAKAAEEIYPQWSERNPDEANMETGYMFYFHGSSLVSVGHHAEGIKMLQKAKDHFAKVSAGDWMQHCDQNIGDAQKLLEKAEQEKKKESEEKEDGEGEQDRAQPAGN